MIYLHCGWPKTGTTSLQAALVEHQARLARAGVVYPSQWRHSAGSHRFGSVLEGLQDDPGTMLELRRFLDENAGRDVLFSSENLSIWTMGSKPRKLLRFLGVLREAAPVRCIWSLLRADEMLQSIFRQMAFAGGKAPRVNLMESMDLSNVFAGMLQVQRAVDDDAVYLKYDRAGRHNVELLLAAGVPAELADDIGIDLETGPRLNPSVTQKALVAVLNAEYLLARAGMKSDTDVLRDVFRRGFRFDDDRPCVLASYEQRRSAHERALAAARRLGFAPYERFFEDEVVEDRSPVADLDAEVLSDEDVDRLIAHLRQPVGA